MTQTAEDRLTRPTIGETTTSRTGSTATRLAKAVHRSSMFSRQGLEERMFTWLFSGLVYPQIWEDPRVDMEGLALGPGSRAITIASGGCNALSYLTAEPEQVIAVDLNAHHVALVELKQAGLRHMPSYQMFYRFFGQADHPHNPRLYDQFLRPHLSETTRAYWDRRDMLLRRRVRAFTTNIYRCGLLGNFIGLGHRAASMLGVRLTDMLGCRDMDEQAAYFDEKIAPMFQSRVVRWVTGQRASLFGLGIPPAQYDSLVRDGEGDMALVLKRRLRKLLCDFPLSDNYFAWQALARRYAPGDAGPLPPYLQSRHFENLRAQADRLSVEPASITERLKSEPDQALDAFVLLDAQDWMTDDQLNELWSEITRTAKPGARVLFRTSDTPSLLPGRVRPALLDQWSYREEQSADLSRRDRSAIYGAVHLYEREARADA